MTDIRLFAPTDMHGQFRKDLENLVEQVESEFIPPLSSRASTHDTSFAGVPDDLSIYLDNLCSQQTFIAYDPDPIGFFSFRPHWQDESIVAGDHHYISTLAVSPRARRTGLASRMYEAFAQVASGPVVVRTWSTNFGHTALLERLGFVEIHRLSDHRAPGVDTVYFRRVYP